MHSVLLGYYTQRLLDNHNLSVVEIPSLGGGLAVHVVENAALGIDPAVVLFFGLFQDGP